MRTLPLISPFCLVYLMPLYHRDPSSLLHPPALCAPPTDDPFESLDTAYDPSKSNLLYQMVYTTSETNTTSLLHVFENSHSNTIATSSCLSVAMTFILDTREKGGKCGRKGKKGEIKRKKGERKFEKRKQKGKINAK